MEPLILEILAGDLHRYHALDKPEIRIGRSLDNDIILSDATVEPHHLVISRSEDGSVELRNLAEINPTRFEGKIKNALNTSTLPINLRLGRISARLLSRNQQVPETKTLADGGSHISRLAIWAVILVSLCFFIAGLEFHLDSFNKYKWNDLVEYILREPAMNIAAFVIVLSVLERLLVNRWEIIPVTVTVSLVFLIYHLLSPLMDELVYIFSSSIPMYLFNIGWYLVFIPLAIWLYLVKVTHLKQSRSVLLAVFISSPFAIISIMQNPAIQSLFDDFSPSAKYQNSLSALNWHVSNTVSIDTFIVEADRLDAGEYVD